MIFKIQPPFTSKWLLIFFVVFTLLIGGVGYHYYFHQKNQVKAETWKDLQSIAELKMGQILNWRQEHLKDARVISLCPFLAKNIFHIQDNPDSPARKNILHRLETIRSNYRYQSILAFDDRGKLLLSYPEKTGGVCSTTKALVAEALRTRKMILSDLYRSGRTGEVRISLVAPVFLYKENDPNDKTPTLAGLLFFRIDPFHFLYPLVQSWPVPSPTAETILSRIENNELLCLNELRHLKNTALSLRIPIGPRKPAVEKTLKGGEAVYEGIDYRGVPVLAVARKIPDSTWHLVAKIDEDEVYAPMRPIAGITAGVVLLLILGMGGGIFLLYRQQQIHFQQRLAARSALQASEARFSTFFHASPLGIAFSRLKDKQILEVNEAWEKLTGFSREETIGRTPKALTLWADIEERELLKEKIISQGTVKDFEVRVRKKSGDIAIFSLSVEQVELEGEPCLLSMALDITERQRAEKALRENEARFREIFENMTEGVAIYQAVEEGNDFVFKDINPAGARGGKVERREVIGRSVRELFPGIKGMGLLEVLQEVYQSGKPKWHPVSYYKDDRISLWVENYVFKLPSGEIVAVYEDLTERKTSQEKLRESEEKFRHLVEAASEGICKVDENFIITYANRQMAEMLGYESEEMVGRGIEDFIFPEDLGSHTSKKADRRKGLLERYERKFRHKTGATIWTIVSPKPSIDENGNFKGSFATFTDITLRKKMEEILNESEEKYRILFEHTGTGLIIVEEDTTISLANNEFVKLSGYSKEEIEGKKKSADFALPEDRERIHYFHDLRRKDSEAAPREYESRIVDNQGNVKNTFNIVAMVPGTSKSIVSFNDITERKKAESALLEKQQQLQGMAIRMSEVEESERKEIARTLHDLVGQNLTALNLNLNIAISMLPDQTSSIIIHRLEDAQKLLEETTQHMREVMTDLRPSVLDDFGLLAALYWYGERFKALTGIETNIEGKEFFPRLPSIMESIIFRVAQEALTNVSKHAGADRVEIILGKRSGKAQLIIADNGRGFLFKGFRPGGEKKGWGLATMQERAVTLGGNLQVLSEPGKGTRIILQLPVER